MNKINRFDYIKHSSRMRKIINAILDDLDCSPIIKSKLPYCASVHDLGKAFVPERFLYCDILTTEAWEEIKKHTVKGYEQIQKFDYDQDVWSAVLHHHEKFDGTGYPDGLSGERIPEIAHIISILDGFETATAGRFYQEPVSVEQAIIDIKNYSGTKYNPRIASMVVRAIELHIDEIKRIS